ncbi:tRNA adenosine(34) deaminase TadA [Desulfolutivibrio sulfoxidireducens]|uniref:tRNA adenosine(34) deaminase TadA n=1 Tax=Desulfolutivibrio sulfoxidireducens TaxID=2773299 RepID=UPI001FE702F9|nr:tRNA adenosine(34) deaminase TadA [Desulfolutivibrio sulfoxidireducens]
MDIPAPPSLALTDPPPLPPGLDSWESAMDVALAEAEAAAAFGDVPVGAVVFSAEGRLLAQAGNSPLRSGDPTAHAEVLALRRAAEAAGNYRLTGSILVATLEPCLMCLGAMVHARVGLLVYGAADPKSGAAGSRIAAMDLPFLNHRMKVFGGVRATECGEMLKAFFQARRGRRENGREA